MFFKIKQLIASFQKKLCIQKKFSSVTVKAMAAKKLQTPLF